MRGTSAGAAPGFLALDKADYELPPGKAKMILYGRIPVLLLRPAEGNAALRMFVATCTHLNCTVSYQEDENRIYCACHDGIYDTEGRVVSGPPPRPLRQLYSKLNDGKLIIALEKANLEKATWRKQTLKSVLTITGGRPSAPRPLPGSASGSTGSRWPERWRKRRCPSIAIAGSICWAGPRCSCSPFRWPPAAC